MCLCAIFSSSHTQMFPSDFGLGATAIVWDLQCTLSYLALRRVLTALRVAYARGAVVLPTGATCSLITNVCFIDNRNILAHNLNRSNLHLNSNVSKVLGSNLCRYLRRANLPPSGQDLTTKLATSFRQDHFRVRKPLNHTKMWTNYLSERHDKSLNLANDFSQNYMSNSTLNSPNLNPKFPSFSKMRGFKIAFLNMCSLTCHYDDRELCVFMEDRAIDKLGLNETRLDNTIADSQFDIEGYDILRRDRNRNGGGGE